MLLDLVVKGQVTPVDVIDDVGSLPDPGRVHFGVGLLGLQLVEHLQLPVVGILEVRFLPLQREKPPLLQLHLEQGIVNLLLYILRDGVGPQRFPGAVHNKINTPISYKVEIICCPSSQSACL